MLATLRSNRDAKHVGREERDPIERDEYANDVPAARPRHLCCGNNEMRIAKRPLLLLYQFYKLRLK
jgi:hypothetical protein